MAATAANNSRSSRRRHHHSSPTIDEWVAEFIKRTVQKMLLAELMTILRKWGFLTDKELQTIPIKGSKENIALEVVHLCEVKHATLNHAADLDIIYNHSNSKKKLWEVYQMSTPIESEINYIDVSEFKARFKKTILSVTKNVTVHFKDIGDSIWIRMAWGQDSMKPNQYKPTFVVYHTQTPYMFFACLPRTFRPFLCHALLSAARYTQIDEMDLKSRCLDSLKDIVFNRFNKNLQGCHPRLLQEYNYEPAIEDSRVIYENLKEKERIYDLNREAFGDGSLPNLEYASYKLQTTFKGELDIAERIEPFRCVVKFCSQNVLESVRSMAPLGISEAPVSHLLTCIPHSARNLFKISDKKKKKKKKKKPTSKGAVH